MPYREDKMRASQRDVQDAVVAYQKAAEAVFGYLPELQLHTGSKVNGVTWKLYELVRDPSGSFTATYTATPPGVPDIHLGWTATEAYKQLTTITGVLWSVVYLKD